MGVLSLWSNANKRVTKEAFCKVNPLWNMPQAKQRLHSTYFNAILVSQDGIARLRMTACSN